MIPTIILAILLGALGIGHVFLARRCAALATQQQLLMDGLVALGKDLAEAGARLDELHGKSLEALRRVVANNSQVHESQGQLAIEYGARLAAIETLLAHARRHWGDSLKRLYERARVELTIKATPETRIAPVPASDDAAQIIKASEEIAEATEYEESDNLIPDGEAAAG